MNANTDTFIATVCSDPTLLATLITSIDPDDIIYYLTDAQKSVIINSVIPMHMNEYVDTEVKIITFDADSTTISGTDNLLAIDYIKSHLNGPPNYGVKNSVYVTGFSQTSDTIAKNRANAVKAELLKSGSIRVNSTYSGQRTTTNRVEIIMFKKK
jgi:outer membrane protein OmpA-like peptidoglycan-associated protein